MALTKACCTLPPVVSNYTPKGTTFELDGMSVYETPDKTPKKVLICAYDIFGVHQNIRQFADILAQAGFLIAVPDFFRGNEIDKDNFPPPGGFQAILEFVGKHGTWNNTVKKDFIALINHYKAQGIVDFGVFGFCWGGRISIDAGTDIPEVKAAGLVHPSLWKTEDAEGIKAATILVPAKDEADMIPFYEILKKNLGEDKCAHHRYDDMQHGFCGARGDLTDPNIVSRVNEVIGLLRDFFTTHV